MADQFSILSHFFGQYSGISWTTLCFFECFRLCILKSVCCPRHLCELALLPANDSMLIFYAEYNYIRNKCISRVFFLHIIFHPSSGGISSALLRT